MLVFMCGEIALCVKKQVKQGSTASIFHWNSRLSPQIGRVNHDNRKTVRGGPLQREREEGKGAVEEQSRCKGNSNRGLLGKWQSRQNAALACALCTGGELEFLIKRCIRHRKSWFKEELNFSPKEHEVLYPRHEIQNNLVKNLKKL